MSKQKSRQAAAPGGWTVEGKHNYHFLNYITGSEITQVKEHRK